MNLLDFTFFFSRLVTKNLKNLQKIMILRFGKIYPGKKHWEEVLSILYEIVLFISMAKIERVVGNSCWTHWQTL
jgi:hypothetical protein